MMKLNFLVIFTVVAVGGACVARAYEIPSASPLPVPSVLAATGSAQTYDVQTSFSNLISPLEDFFNSMKVSNAVPTTFNVGGNASSAVSVSVNVQPYINQYSNELDAWSYEHMGIHIQWLITIIINILFWIFGLVNSAVRWIAGLFH
jgi:hypothetical protein